MQTSRYKPTVCIVDYGLGNIFSIWNACQLSDLDAIVSSKARDIMKSDIIILPGVGAYSVAMESLRSLDLISPIREASGSSSILVGICLGMQLFMSESEEFGTHEGLRLISGKTLSLASSVENNTTKVPHIGWNRINSNQTTDKSIDSPDLWTETPLKGINQSEFMYFIHSFYVVPDDPKLILSTTLYGPLEFASSIKSKNIFGFQFHPERSGKAGLKMYKNLRDMAAKVKESGDV